VRAAPAAPAASRAVAAAVAAVAWRTRVLAYLPLQGGTQGPLRLFASLASASRAWALAAELFAAPSAAEDRGDIGSDVASAVWARWGGMRWPGLGESALAKPGAHCSAALLRECLRWPPPAPSAAQEAPLAAWAFVVEVRREARSLWRATLAGEENLIKAAPGSCATLLERVDTVLPGDLRRLAVAGVVAALNDGKAEETCHAGLLVAIHWPSGRRVRLPVALAPNSRRDPAEAPPAGAWAPTSAGGPAVLMGAVVGLGCRPARSSYPQGSLEVQLGLAFVGPGGQWLQGGALVVAAMLEALAAWSPNAV